MNRIGEDVAQNSFMHGVSQVLGHLGFQCPLDQFFSQQLEQAILTTSF